MMPIGVAMSQTLLRRVHDISCFTQCGMLFSLNISWIKKKKSLIACQQRYLFCFYTTTYPRLLCSKWILNDARDENKNAPRGHALIIMKVTKKKRRCRTGGAKSLKLRDNRVWRVLWISDASFDGRRNVVISVIVDNAQVRSVTGAVCAVSPSRSKKDTCLLVQKCISTSKKK